jgi:hypothetical protein
MRVGPTRYERRETREERRVKREERREKSVYAGGLDEIREMRQE